MIKRPLIWLLGAFLTGILFAWSAVPFGYIAAILILAVITLYLLLIRFTNRLLGKKDRFLWCLPILFLLGYLSMVERMNPPDLYYVFDQKITCKLSGRISMIVEREQGLTLHVTNNNISLSNERSYQCEKIMIYTSVHQNYLVGNQITASGTLIKFLPATNPGQFNEQQYYQIENIDFKMQADDISITDSKYSPYHKVLGSMKGRLIKVYTTILNKKEAGTLIAMLLGEKYLLDEEIKTIYQTGGISHILAISGLHISLIGMGIFWLMKKCRLPRIPSTFLTIFLLYSYGELTNFSVSTNRAVVMMTVLLLASIFGKTYDMLSATAFSAFLILLQNPLQLFSAGFLLSFAAVLGISTLLPGLKQLFPRDNPLLNSLLVSISAMAATNPLILYFFYQYPTYSILVNLLILPFVTILTLTSLFAGIIGVFSLPSGIFLIGGSNYVLILYEAICRINDHLPYCLITTGRPAGLLLLSSSFLMIFFIILSRRYQKKISLVLLVLSIAILFLPRRNVGLELTMLDIGQGDAIYMESASGTSFLIDGGSSTVSRVGTYRIVPFLKSQGMKKLDYAIITHTDLDHINGVIEIIEQELFFVGCLVLPEWKDKDEPYLRLESLAEEKGIPLRYIRAGDYIKEGRLEIDCLHPASDASALNSNAGSIVLSVTYGEFDMLLTGDLEGEGERQLIQRLYGGVNQKLRGNTPVVDYEVLKVAHHGSKYSTSEELLNMIRPEIAIISSGKNNRYGHPHEELIRRLEDINSNIYITAKEGAIKIQTDGLYLKIQGYLEVHNEEW